MIETKNPLAPYSSRTLIFSGLPQKHPSDLAELHVALHYVEDDPHAGGSPSRVLKAIALDNQVIPAIRNALAQRADSDKLRKALNRCLDFWNAPPQGFGMNQRRALLFDEIKQEAAAALAAPNRDPFKEAMPQVLAALKETLDALYNETHGNETPWITQVKQKAADAIARAEEL